MMELLRYNPWREMIGARHRGGGLFDELFFPANVGEDNVAAWNWNPVVDVYETDEHFVIKADLPGIDKDDLALDVKSGVLTLKGERSAEDEVKKENIHFRERSYGRFVRSFKLPDHIDTDKITADYTNGVLKIEIPKPENAKPKQITVH